MSRENWLFGGAVVVSSLLFVACGPPPSPPEKASSPATTDHPIVPLPGDTSGAVAAAPAPSAELGPLAPAFQPFLLPPGTPPVVSVAGRGERDVWLLAPGELDPKQILHWDGTSLSTEPVSPCHLYMNHASVVLDSTGPIVRDETHTEGDIWFHAARRSASGSWACDLVDRTRRIVPLGTTWLRVPFRRPQVVISGRTLPEPARSMSFGRRIDVVGNAIDDFWLYGNEGSAVVHWNGVKWEDRSPGFEYISLMSMDSQGDIWLLGRRTVMPPYDDEVLRWDRDTRTWAHFPVPAGLRSEIFLASSVSDVWLIGKSETYHWNGAVFQRGATPTSYLKDAWIDADGGLWVVGADRNPTDADSRGVVFRARGAGKL